MGRITALDEDTVKKIAAGEVVERPASVVKELIENSLDAGSTKVSVEVANGGKKLIRVSDDGVGMECEDAELCFGRYTTSKIKKIDDLDSLRTLGFRGEALASICAVSKVELQTKPRGRIEGTMLLIEAGKPKEVNDVGCPEGTSVVVKDLFYNLPARKKHLKSARRELAHITDVVTRYSLARNDVFFSLNHDKTKIMESPPTGSLLDCATNIFGASISKNLVPLDYDSQTLRITGLLGKPHSTRGSAAMQFFYVNGRYVSSRLVSAAVREAYGTLLPKNRYPVCIVAIEIRPEYVDVNIHPTKQQVKFSDENEVYASVVKAVKSALESRSLMPDAIPKRVERMAKAPRPDAGRPAKPSRLVPLTIETYRRRFPSIPEKATLPELKIMGDIHETYILGESSRGMVILDQHAVHERILYERLLTAKTKAQELITPMTLELSPKEGAVLEEFTEHLTSLGFGFEPFGRNTCRINSVPVVLGALVSPEIIRDILNDMVALPKAEEKGVEERIAQIIAKRSASAACKSAIKAGEKQTLESLEHLINELYKTSNPYTCPHGRPTMISITKEELEKRFLRT